MENNIYIYMHTLEKIFSFCNVNKSEVFAKQCGCDGSFLSTCFFSSLIWDMVDFRNYQRLMFFKYVLLALLLFCRAEHCC